MLQPPAASRLNLRTVYGGDREGSTLSEYREGSSLSSELDKG